MLSPAQKRKRPGRKPVPDEIPESPWRTVDNTSSAPVDIDADISSSGRRLVLQMRGMQLDEEVAVEEVAVEDVPPEKMDVEIHPPVKRRRSSDWDHYADDNGDADMDVERGNGNGNGKVVMMATNQGTRQSRRMRSPPPEHLHLAEKHLGTDTVDTSKSEEEWSEGDVDGYGIAYAPTSQQRDLRKQKRLQQIREYKTRESREARQRRMEQRRRRRSSSLAQNGSGSSQKKDSSDEGKKKSVHFSV
ncbi:hypothetical protein EX30DRAFT_396509 [Ascodesmis nigricans]|uniref:Uncharacterized protein n=1 Tax=Ascodesmis nigricans TaxID=341454 RepID=A0A4S2MUM1_9PEZI|nr:hypothetical protein EX30DRAFT_396509 [Ascodesmis nigricans]